MERAINYIPLTRDFFARNTIEVAKGVVGKYLVRNMEGVGLLVARIVEVEAYLSKDDLAAHAYLGKTKRTQILYGKPGHAYIFQMHGHNCLNFVAEPEHSPGCVLIRAAQPFVGLELMRKFRGKGNIRERDMSNGPGKLCRALAIDISLYGIDLVDVKSPLQVCEDVQRERVDLDVSKRIGVTQSTDKKLRFSIRGNIFVSK